MKHEERERKRERERERERVKFDGRYRIIHYRAIVLGMINHISCHISYIT